MIHRETSIVMSQLRDYETLLLHYGVKKIGEPNNPYFDNIFKYNAFCRLTHLAYYSNIHSAYVVHSHCETPEGFFSLITELRDRKLLHPTLNHHNILEHLQMCVEDMQFTQQLIKYTAFSFLAIMCVGAIIYTCPHLRKNILERCYESLPSINFSKLLDL